MSQGWEIRLNRNVRKTLKKLGKAVNRRLKTALKKLEENPKLGKGLFRDIQTFILIERALQEENTG